MNAAQAASPRLPASVAPVPQRVVAPLTGDDGAATPPAAHRLLVDPQAAGGPRADDAMVEQDANNVATEQASEFNPGLARHPWLPRASINILHPRAMAKHGAEECACRLCLWVFY
jgi:hypothetical protein